MGATSPLGILRAIGRDLLDVIAPHLCPCCDGRLDPGEFYCRSCRSSLEPAPWPDAIMSELSAHVSRDELALSACASLYAYRRESPVQQLIHAVKYRGCEPLGEELGRELGRALPHFASFIDLDLVVAVPLHPARRRERGFNQAEAIGRGLSSALARPLEVGILRRGRYASSQTRLGVDDRRGNVAGAFSTTGRIDGARVLLCDDVCTTGATLNQCAVALLSAGASRVVAATVAKDMIEGAVG